MTDRLKGVTVAFDHDIRDDDAEVLIAAIRQLRGVADVQPSVSNVSDHIARMRIDQEWRTRIIGLLDYEG